jgi:hypothetical protein
MNNFTIYDWIVLGGFFLLLAGCSIRETPAYFVAGVQNPLMSLNGQWEICTDFSGIFPDAEIPADKWRSIQVPGECMMQGYAIQHDKPFYYKRSIYIPEDYDNKIIKLRFDGVYSYARVWVNGNFIRDHSGGFTRWECAISPYVVPGDTALLIMEVTDKSDEISFASGYAKHPIGGILREVSLLALPYVYPEKIEISSDLDSIYKDALLCVSGKLNQAGKNAGIRLELRGPEGRKVPLESKAFSKGESQDFRILNRVKDPLKWDAEHPNLYILKVTCSQDKKDLWYKVYRIGFREVEVRGNSLLVNGKQVKLRGACKHDIHPLLGRASTPDYELLDVHMAKEANINFIRTSHYPPTDNFLSLCDKYGIYVEDETAVCFVGTHRTAAYAPGATENMPDYTDRYLSQLREMLENHRNHPSVIIWSVGNENDFGTNFKKSYDLVKEADPTRPVMFSYPGKVPGSIKCYDIISMHYPGIHGNMNQYGIVTNSFTNPDKPVIFDEWAHVPCYNNFTVREDPNIRDFWGVSLDSMWQRAFAAEGAAGGAIWGMIDETFMLPDTLSGFGAWWGVVDKNVIPSGYAGTCVGYGEWGIVDTWRRKKPEFWNTKKAYSPVRILYTSFTEPAERKVLYVPVQNRFDHTSLNELTITLRYKNKDQVLEPVDIEPHARGNIPVNIEGWEPGDIAFIYFYDRKGYLVDSCTILLQSGDIPARNTDSAGQLQVSENEDQIIVQSDKDRKLVFDKTTGLVEGLQTPEDTLLLHGPFLNLRTRGPELAYTNNEINDYGGEWKAERVSCALEGSEAVVRLKGTYSGLIPVLFEIHVSSGGEIRTMYRLEKVPQEYIREAGIKWILEDRYDSLSWSRKTYWSSYPEGYISAPSGKVSLYSSAINKYRQQPVKDWEYDTKSFYYDGIGNEKPGEQLTNIARATKEKIYEYSLMNNGKKVLSVEGNGEDGCRIAKQGKELFLFVNNELDYVDISWGNYQRNILLKDGYTAEAVMKIDQ